MSDDFSDLPFGVERHGDEVIVDLSPLKMLDEAAVQQIRDPLLSLIQRRRRPTSPAPSPTPSS